MTPAKTIIVFIATPPPAEGAIIGERAPQNKDQRSQLVNRDMRRPNGVPKSEMILQGRIFHLPNERELAYLPSIRTGSWARGLF